jgi:hypothetical protein
MEILLGRQEQGGGIGENLEWEKIKKGVLSSTPTYIRCELTFNFDDYGKKGGRTICLTCAGDDPCQNLT